MPRFTSETAAVAGRQGGRCAYSRLEQRFATLVLTDPSTAAIVAHLITRGFRLSIALRAIATPKGRYAHQ
ncbi:MAG: hypothetical protein AB4911_12990 [Oscillochloridaceae bacterium umkhey_bin13]